MYIGLDLGTSGLKAILLDEQQNLLAEAIAPLSVQRPMDGWSEQEPSHWINAAKTVLTDLGKQTSLNGVKAIGLSGQMHGATLLDSNDTVLRPCILWNDTRSADEATAMDQNPSFRRITGNIVFPGFTAPKLAWVSVNEPKVFAQVAKVLLPKDYLRLWLTGEHVAEMSDAAGTSWLDTKKRDWSDELLEVTGLDRSVMPRLVEGSEVSGSIRDDIAVEFGLPKGTLVAGGGGDNAASAVGVGVVRAGSAFVSLGTSGVLFAASDAYQPDADTAVHTFCHALPNTWHQMGVILAAADAVNWWANVAGESAKDLTAELGDLEAPDKSIFLPYLGGERTPHNDAKVRGQFLNLSHDTDKTALTRSVIEGVTFAFKDCFDALSATGTHMDRLIGVGGGTNSDYWVQAIATSQDMPIELPVAGDFGGAFGAARLAMMADGASNDIATIPEIKTVVEPRKDLVAAFAEGHQRYRAAYNAVKSIS